MVCFGSTAPPVSSAEFALTVVRCVLDTIILVLVIVANSLIIFSVLRYRLRQSRGLCVKIETSTDISLRFVLNLAFADIIAGVATFFSYTFDYSCTVSDYLGQMEHICILRFVLVVFAECASGYSLVAIAMDRYTAVVHALRYQDIMTERRVTISIMLIWVAAGLDSSVVFLFNSWDPEAPCTDQSIIPWYFLIANGIVSHCFITGFIVAVHLRIFREASASAQRHAQDAGTLITTKERMSSKSAKTLLRIVVAYTVCWLPFLVMMIVKVIDYRDGTQNPIVSMVYSFAYTLSNVIFVVNPVLYGYTNPIVQTAMMQMFHTCKRQSKVIVKIGNRVKTISDMPLASYGRAV